MHLWMPLWHYFKMFIVICSVMARTENIISLHLHNLLIQAIKCFLFKEKNIRSKLGHDGILLLHQLTHLNNTCGFTSYRRQFPQKDIWQLMKICCDCVTFKTLVMITYWIRLKSWILTWHICGYLPLIEEVD